jgi:hypothetical protein
MSRNQSTAKSMAKRSAPKLATKKTNNASKTGPKTGSKRAHSAIEDDADKENQSGKDSEISDDDPRLKQVTDDCDQVRERIEHFISRSEMTVAEFVKAIGVTKNSYLLFMDHDDPNSGRTNSVYENAWRFFKKRELLSGIQMPPLKSAKRALADSIFATISNQTTAKAPKKVTTKAAMKGDLEKYDVSDILLDGEEDGEVEIYETCDSMRAIVAAHLAKDDVVQASFLREVSKCFGDNPKKMSAAQMKSFMSKEGAHSGSSSAFFYGAYVYFEKLRIKKGEEKSEFREDMEEIWECRPFETQIGFPRKGNQSYIIPSSRKLTEDEYGRPVVY